MGHADFFRFDGEIHQSVGLLPGKQDAKREIRRALISTVCHLIHSCTFVVVPNLIQLINFFHK